jgi:hypothetical protein
MAIILDRDLLVLDARVFVDAPDAATIRVSGADGAISGTTLTSAGSDFAAAEVESGHVIVVAGAALEVVNRLSPTSLTVSRPRASADDPLVPPAPGSGLTFSVVSFESAADEARAWLLSSLGIDSGDPEAPLDEDYVLNLGDFASLEALRVIQQAYALAAAGDPADLSLADRAAHFARRLAEQKALASAVIDRDGDGSPDAARRLDIVHMRRT